MNIPGQPATVSVRSTKVRVAIVGCGQIAHLHAKRLTADPRAQIVALCDPYPESAERLRREFAPEAMVFTDLPSLLDQCTLDAAVVCTPTQLHFDQVRILRRRGVPVLCEKPLADTRERIVELIDDARTGALLALAYQRRYWSTFRTLRREVLSGRWGPVRSVVAYTIERWQQTIDGTWRNDPGFNPGGFIGDAGSHKIDMVFYVTNQEPREVFARSEKRGSRVEIVTLVSGELSGGTLLDMSFIGDAQHWREDFHVHCAEADLFLRDGGVWIARNNQAERLEPVEPESDPNTAFLDCLTAGAVNVAPAACALPVWDFTQAVLESARLKKPVSVDVERVME